MAKTYAQTYLFGQYGEYAKQTYEFIINAERIDTKSKEFEDILFDIKRRRVSDCLAKIITSPNVVLATNGRSLPKSFRVFVAADARFDGKPKVFIDASDCIVYKNGAYVCSHIDWLISYIIDGMTSYIYVMQENKVTGNASVLKDGGDAWTRCYSYIVDRMYKISTVHDLKAKLDYMAALYYQVSILGKDLEKQNDSIRANAVRISDIDPKQGKVVDIMLEPEDFTNIDTFNKAVGRILNLKDFKTANVVSMWMTAFGTGTVFALEYFPAFSAMLTDTYVGGYINQQMTIEKITGSSMVKFSKTILEIGARAA